jgi:hypothetical protein
MLITHISRGVTLNSATLSNNEIIKKRRLSVTTHFTDVLGRCNTPTARVGKMSHLKG